MMHEGIPSLTVHSQMLGSMQVHLAGAYKHLGTVTDARNRMKPELRHRNASAKGALYPLRGRFYTNPRIPLTPRGWILESDVLSRQLFNTAHWGPLAPGEAKALRGDVAALIRTLMPAELRSPAARISQRALAAWTGRLHLPITLAAAHLAYLCRVCRDRDPQLLAAVQWEHHLAPAGRSWLGHSITAIGELRPYMPISWREAWPMETVEQLLGAIDSSPTAHFKQIVELRKRARAAEGMYAAVLSLYDALGHKTCKEGLNALDGQPGGADDEPQRIAHKCPTCDAAFRTIKSLQAHRVGKHKYRTPHRLWASGTCCIACGTEYHTRQRLIQHMRSRRGYRCYRAGQHVSQPISEAQAAVGPRRGADAARHHHDQV